MTQEKGLFFFMLTVCVALGASFWINKDGDQKQATNQEEKVAMTLKKAESVIQPRDVVLAQTPRVLLSNGKMLLSVRQKGLVIDDVELKTYWDSATKKNKKPFALLSPEGTELPVYVQLGCLVNTPFSPTEETFWDVKESTERFVRFETTVAGVQYECSITLDEQYAVAADFKIINKTESSIDVGAFAQITKTKDSREDSSLVSHEGFAGYVAESLQEKNYSKMDKERFVFDMEKSGWCGFVSKYWMLSLMPDSKATCAAYASQKGRSYVAHTVLPSCSLKKGEECTRRIHMFVGPKKREVLTKYENTFKWRSFEQAIDYGVFYFITKPALILVTWLYSLLKSFGLVILIITFLVRLALFPLARKSHAAMKRMRQLQPKMKKLQDLYAGDKMRLHQEMAKLYKGQKVNPLSGFVPMLVQIPIFFALYKVLFISFEMRHAPFLWVRDLAQPDPTSVLTLCGLIPLPLPSFLIVGFLPAIMGVTMFFQQKLSAVSVDAAQQKIMRFLPVIFVFMLANFPAGLVLYWTVSNIVSVGQQWFLRRNEA